MTRSDRRRIRRAILRRAKLPRQVENAYQRRRGSIGRAIDNLPESVRVDLERAPGHRWDVPVASVARQIADSLPAVAEVSREGTIGTSTEPNTD